MKENIRKDECELERFVELKKLPYILHIDFNAMKIYRNFDFSADRKIDK